MVAVSPAPRQAPARPGSSFLYAGCCFLAFLSHHVAAAAAPPPSFSFDFSNTSSYSLQDLRFEGDAALNDNLVDLTCNSKEAEQNIFCKGRMSYSHPVPFYDNNTGEVASFFTQFTFAIKLNNGVQRGNGMAFFLSGYPSVLPPSSSGSWIGLTDSSNQTVQTILGSSRFVAVEFDTYANSWDPTGSSDHIAIDLSSVTSVSATRLPSYSLNGTMTATITFDNTTRMLEASLHFDDNPSLGAAQVKTQLPEPLDALLPPEVAVGFSAGTGGYFELHQILSWSFDSTMSKIDSTVGPKETPGANNALPKQGQAVGTKGRHGAAALNIGVVLALVVVIWSILSWCRWRRTRDSFGKGSRLRRFEYRELYHATDGFSPKNVVGKGGFGEVYKGSLKDGNGKEQRAVAVKKIYRDSGGESRDFFAELDAIGRTGHGNVVRLEGWCCSRNRWNLLDFMCWCCKRRNFKLFLVYELVPNGNLEEHLRRRPEVLPWTKRYKIVMGIGSALRYLHHDCNPYILHRDIKPANILLDDDFNAKLGDFGLSRTARHNETSLLTSVAVGTRDYMDPSCKKVGEVRFRRSSDIYSFGIVLLEIAHGQNNPDRVRQLHATQPETIMEVAADKKLLGQFDRTQMERVIALGLKCSDPDESQRPSLISAMQFLEHGGELRLATPEERHAAGTVRARSSSSEQQAFMVHGTVRSI